MCCRCRYSSHHKRQVAKWTWRSSHELFSRSTFALLVCQIFLRPKLVGYLAARSSECIRASKLRPVGHDRPTACWPNACQRGGRVVSSHGPASLVTALLCLVFRHLFGRQGQQPRQPGRTRVTGACPTTLVAEISLAHQARTVLCTHVVSLLCRTMERMQLPANGPPPPLQQNRDLDSH